MTMFGTVLNPKSAIGHRVAADRPRPPLKPDRALAIRVAIVATALWLVSLVLPSFTTGPYEGPRFGFSILLEGLAWGWFFGWAVYANVFFVIIAARFSGNKPLRALALWMVALAATLPLFPGTPADYGIGFDPQPVESWGWGAVVWVLAILVLTLAVAVRAGVVRRFGVSVFGAICATAVVSLGALHGWQWAQANDQERAYYLPVSMAFTLTNFCGVPFTWPAQSLLPPDEVVSLDINPELKLWKGGGGAPYLTIYPFVRSQENGFATHKAKASYARAGMAGWTDDAVTVRTAATLRRYTLHWARTTEGAVARLVDSHTDTTLYEQRIKTGTPGGRRGCPTDSGPMGYSAAILRALGQAPPAHPSAERTRLRAETAQTSCELVPENTGDPGSWWQWDGRVAHVQMMGPKDVAGFCSENYIGLVQLREGAGVGETGLAADVHIFERTSLKPIALFTNGRHLDKKALDISKSLVQGIQIEDASVTVATTRGELVVQRTR